MKVISHVLKIHSAILLMLIGINQANSHEELAATNNSHKKSQSPNTKQKIHIKSISKGLYIFTGEGPVGNVGVSIGADGTLLIDDQFKSSATGLLNAIKELGGDAPKFLINTHYHFDHAGGNTLFGDTGTIITAHESVRKQLKRGSKISTFNMTIQPAPKNALPVLTFPKEISLHFNGDHLKLLHLPNAHTEGDIIVQFIERNVIHAGDVFMNTNNFPFIDVEHGGSLEGVINAQKILADKADEKTVIIPGHGPLANKEDLVTYTKNLSKILLVLKAHAELGRSVEEVVALNPIDQVVKFNKGVLTQEKWIRLLYPSILESL